MWLQVRRGSLACQAALLWGSSDLVSHLPMAEPETSEDVGNGLAALLDYGEPDEAALPLSTLLQPPSPKRVKYNENVKISTKAYVPKRYRTEPAATRPAVANSSTSLSDDDILDSRFYVEPSNICGPHATILNQLSTNLPISIETAVALRSKGVPAATTARVPTRKLVEWRGGVAATDPTCTETNSTAEAPKFTTRHTASVNCLRWSPASSYGRLLASASMDKTVILWAPFDHQSALMRLECHRGAVRDLDWRPDSAQLASCGFEENVHLTDTETGSNILNLHHPEYVTAIKFHPKDSSLLTCGLFSSGLVTWDLRANQIITKYKLNLGLIQALEFPDSEGNQLLTCPDVTKRSAVDKAVLAWDFKSGAPMSYQIYHEAYTCTSIHRHPQGHSVCAQSSAGYIIRCDSSPPYKLNKGKRFEGHDVAGYRVGFDISPDGNLVASGSASGEMVFYNWSSTKVIRRIRTKCGSAACLDIAFHPILPSVVASCLSDGSVSVWE